MASSDMASLDPWGLRPSFIDPWFYEALSRETQTLTRALSQSLSGSNSDFFSAVDGLAPDTFPCLLNPLPKPEAAPTPAVSNVSGGSDLEPYTKKRQRSAIPSSATSGKATKRKPRQSKRSQTTFITADRENFRQMVQQVTGVRFGGCSQLQGAAAILRPEPQRPSSRFSAGAIPSGCLPTLDTSAFLLDSNHESHHHRELQQQQQKQQAKVGTSPTTPSSAGGAALPYLAVADVGLDFDSFPAFPTLESWKAM